MVKPPVQIISPALEVDNNGNWQTAQRWRAFLEADFEVSIARDWDLASGAQCLIALHARRSSAALRRYRAQDANRPIILIMTGTDLYRDIKNDPDAQHSVNVANRIVVLQSAGLEELDARSRARAVVIHQSAATLDAVPGASKPMELVVVGHLRAEKDPLTAMDAFQRMDPTLGIRMTHIGAALEPTLGRAAAALAAQNDRYQWLGSLPHAVTRERIRTAKLLVICSLMEGGANVVIEALTAGTPVLASRISGNVGLLGAEYPGYFPTGDAQALAALIARCASDAAFYERLNTACALRAPLFAPERERQEVIKLVRSALAPI